VVCNSQDVLWDEPIHLLRASGTCSGVPAISRGIPGDPG
jgi:hypothetical protein